MAAVKILQSTVNKGFMENVFADLKCIFQFLSGVVLTDGRH